MSYKDVFDVFKRERRLNNDETALLNSLRHMTDTERELLAETLGPPAKVKSAKPATKKFKKCDVCGVSRKAARHRDTSLPDYHEFDEGHRPMANKSARATGMAAQLNRNLQSQQRVTTPALCSYEIDGKVCHGEEGDGIHDKSLGYGNYHPFVSSSSARNAAGKSSTSGSEASSETGSDAVSSAAAGGD